jgi:CubicO group peptidase (beta-lactamase class C family)
MRPVLIALALLMLVTVSLAAGVLAADWPFWQRAWAWHEATPQSPVRLPGARARLESAAGVRDLPLDVDPGITSAVSRLLDDAGTAALLVARDDRVLFEYYGGTADADVRFDGGELSTLPLVVLYGAAAERGVGATLDGSIATQLGEWREDARGEITARLLLQGLSGLEGANGSLFNPFGRTARLASGPNFERAALSFRTTWPAGSHFVANPADAQIAATVLARAAERPLMGLLHEWVVEPLQFASINVLLDRHRGAMAAHCCIQARARDWLSLGLLVAQGGTLGGRRVYSEQFAQQIERTSPVAPDRGLGLRRIELQDGRHGLLAQGRTRLLLADPASRTAWLWISTADFTPGQIDQLLGAATEGSARQPAP